MVAKGEPRVHGRDGRRSFLANSVWALATVFLLALAPHAQATSWQQVWPETERLDEAFIPIIDHYGGVTVWSRLVDGAGPDYALYAMRHGQVERLPIETRQTPFDVDLGPSSEGGVVAAYSRCGSEPVSFEGPNLSQDVLYASLPYPPWTTGRGCDIYRYDFATGNESRLRGASTNQASEMLPSIWKDEVAFARVYERRDGKRGTYPYLYVRPLTEAESATSKRQPGGSRGAEGLPGPTRLDLYGRRLGFVWNSLLPTDEKGHRPRQRSVLRLDTVDGGHQVLSHATSGSRTQPGVASFLGPQGSDGRIYYGFQRAVLDRDGEDRSVTSLLLRYRLSTGDKALASAPPFIIDASTDAGQTFLGVTPEKLSWAEGVPGKILSSSQVTYRDPSGPRIVSVEYGRHQPPGSQWTFYGLKVRAQDPDGQIVSMDVVPVDGGSGSHADGACGLGGKTTGEIETWYLPTGRLEPGTYRYRVTVGSSSCDAANRGQETTAIFTVHSEG